MLVTSEMAVCLCTPYSSEWWRTDQELPFVRSGVISSEESKLQNTQTTENVKVHKTATAIRARINQCNDRDIDTAVAPSKETNSKTCERFLTMQLLFKSLF